MGVWLLYLDSSVYSLSFFFPSFLSLPFFLFIDTLGFHIVHPDHTISQFFPLSAPPTLVTSPCKNKK